MSENEDVVVLQTEEEIAKARELRKRKVAAAAETTTVAELHYALTSYDDEWDYSEDGGEGLALWAKGRLLMPYLLKAAVDGDFYDSDEKHQGAAVRIAATALDNFFDAKVSEEQATAILADMKELVWQMTWSRYLTPETQQKVECLKALLGQLVPDQQ